MNIQYNRDVTNGAFTTGAAGSELSWWDTGYNNLVNVAWASPERLLVSVQSRSQTDLLVLAANPVTGETDVVLRDSDDQWVEIVVGTAPASSTPAAPS